MIFGRVEEKIDKIVEHMSSIDVTLAKQAVVLEEHVKRTDILQAKVEPIEKTFSTARGILKIVSLVGMGVIIKIVHAILAGHQ